MPKTATFAVRVDEELKTQSREVLESIGLPMSLAVKLCLHQIVTKGRLPFALGPEEDGALRRARARREQEMKKTRPLITRKT